MGIVKQIDADYAGDGVVAFVVAAPRYRAGYRFGEEFVTGETYAVEIHKKPISASAAAFKHCAHEHRSIDAASRCAKSLLKQCRRSMEEA